MELCDRFILTLAIYHSPAASREVFFDLLDKCLAHITKRNLRVIIGEDWNVHLNFGTPEALGFVNLLRSDGFYPTNFQPTRGRACIVNAAINVEPEDYCTLVEDPVIADHAAVSVRVSAQAESNCLPL